MIARLLCALRGTHISYSRSVLGGFRCNDCGKPAASLEDLGYDDGFVSRYGRTNPR